MHRLSRAVRSTKVDISPQGGITASKVAPKSARMERRQATNHSLVFTKTARQKSPKATADGKAATTKEYSQTYSAGRMMYVTRLVG